VSYGSRSREQTNPRNYVNAVDGWFELGRVVRSFVMGNNKMGDCCQRKAKNGHNPFLAWDHQLQMGKRNHRSPYTDDDPDNYTTILENMGVQRRKDREKPSRELMTVDFLKVARNFILFHVRQTHQTQLRHESAIDL